MLKAGVFDNFKDAKTLLIWGDQSGMTILDDRLSQLQHTNRRELTIGDDMCRLTIRQVVACSDYSFLSVKSAQKARWDCSDDVVNFAKGLVRPLIDQAGHQFVPVSGDAEQIIISCNEYPFNLR